MLKKIKLTNIKKKKTTGFIVGLHIMKPDMFNKT